MVPTLESLLDCTVVHERSSNEVLDTCWVNVQVFRLKAGSVFSKIALRGFASQCTERFQKSFLLGFRPVSSLFLLGFEPCQVQWLLSSVLKLISAGVYNTM